MKFKKLDRKIIYKSKWVNLFIDRVETPTGKIIDEYHVVDFPNESVAIMIENELNEILFVNVYRYITNSIDLEIPAGGIEENEDIISAARRELLEETGYYSDNIKLIYSYYPSNGISNQLFHITKGNVILNNIKSNKFDTDEIYKYQWIDKNALLDLIKNGLIKDGLTLSALFFYFQNLT